MTVPGPLDAALLDALVRDAPDVGAALRAVREALGCSPADLAEQVCVRTSLVTDLEEGRVASSGGRVYARGHLRNLAVAMGVDPAPLLARFDREVGRDAPVQIAAPRDVAPVMHRAGRLAIPVADDPERHGPRWGATGAVAAAVLAGLVVVGAVRDGGAPVADPVAGRVPGAGASTGAPVAPVATSPAAPVTAAPVSPDAVAAAPRTSGQGGQGGVASLRVRATGGTSWVRVETGEAGARRTLFEGLLRDGQSRDFTGRQALDVVVGNAGVVSLVCSGRDLPRAGGAGAIARFSCSDSGLVSA